MMKALLSGDAKRGLRPPFPFCVKIVLLEFKTDIMENVYFLGRLILGAYFLYNAYNHFANIEALTGYAGSKKVPHPKIAVAVTGAMLFVGGVAILTGMSMVLGAWILVAFLVVTSFMMHAYWKLPDTMALKMSEKINFTKNMALVGALLVIVALLY